MATGGNRPRRLGLIKLRALAGRLTFAVAGGAASGQNSPLLEALTGNFNDGYLAVYTRF
jgi:hypothetical protein